MSKTFLKIGLGCLAVAGLALVGTLQAAPFNEQIAFKQPDGTMIQLHGWGDEFQAVFETQDGYTVVYDQGLKAYCYAQQDVNGDLKSLGLQAHLENPASLGLGKHVRMSDKARKNQVLTRWQRWESQMQIQAQWSARKQQMSGLTSGTANNSVAFATTGTKVGLTLLVDFSDDPATIPQAEIINYCNSDSYTGYGNNGSVKKYFYDNSGGQLVYTNVVTVYIRVPQIKSYYNDTSKDAGDQANILIKDALDTLKALPNYATTILPAFANLTVDGSSRVVACNVFYAGGNGGVWSMGLWPHSWSLYNVGAQSLGNGMSVFKYQVSNIGSSLTIGTFCHENGHMLCGYPDIYDYDGDSTGGSGTFCLMGNGNYGGGGRNPVQICAYLKRISGWATTVNLNASSSLIATSGIAGVNFNKFYRYQKPGVPTEYFLIENRERVGRDNPLPSSGLAIWHVDELGDHNNQNTNYNNSHLNYEVSLMQADNLWHFQQNINDGDLNDLYYSGNTAVGYGNQFTDTSGPKALWWDGTASGLAVTDISTPAANMTFRVGTNNVSVIVIPVVASPRPPYGTNFNHILGSNPNGDWHLFVQDDKPIDVGVISNGWFVTLTTANPVGYAADNQVYAEAAGLTLPLGFTLAVTNYGPSSSTNLTVTASLPAGVSLASSNATYGAVAVIGSTLTWSLPNLSINTGAALALSFGGGSTGVLYSITASVASATTDPNPDNDLATASVLPVSGSSAPPSFGGASFGAGSGWFYLTVTNDNGTPTIIQASTNLVDWDNVFTSSVPYTSPFTFTNFDSSNYPARFYRALLGP